MFEIITTSLPEGYVRKEYYTQLKTNCEDPSPLIWEIEYGGVLPKGLVLSEEGIISGIPEETSFVDYYFSVTNQKTGDSTGKVLKLVIGSDTPEELKIISDSVPDATVGVLYNFQFKCSGGVPPYTWSIDSLPAGLSFSKSGTITGIVKFSGGAAPITVKVCDSTDKSVSRFFLINVR